MIFEETKSTVGDLAGSTWFIAPTGETQLGQHEHGIHVVILARDEAAIIGGTVRALSIGLGGDDQIHVVADHCHDLTAAKARDAGAIVHIRSDGGPAGKGQALRWWLEATRREGARDDILVILDADSIVAPNFFETVRRRMRRGEEVLQTRVEPVVRTFSPIARIAAYSETTEQRVNDAIRDRLGWPVRLRGTGMVFKRHVLEKICRSLSTLVEDVELTLQLGAQRTRIHFVHETYVADPKPNDQEGAVRQRARWMKGQIQVIQSYFREILKLIARGPAGWSLLSSVLLKPKTLLIPLKASATLAAWLGAFVWGGVFWLIPAILGSLSLLFDGATFLYGLRYAVDRREALRTLALAPLYVIVWLRSLALSAVSGTVWHRVRPINPEMPLPETGFFASLERYLKVHQGSGKVSVRPVIADGGD